MATLYPETRRLLGFSFYEYHFLGAENLLVFLASVNLFFFPVWKYLSGGAPALVVFFVYRMRKELIPFLVHLF